MCQGREWLPHRSGDLFQLWDCNLPETDSKYPIAILECGNDVIDSPCAGVNLPYGYTKWWPAIRQHPYRCSSCAVKLQRGDPKIIVRHLRHTCISAKPFLDTLKRIHKQSIRIRLGRHRQEARQLSPGLGLHHTRLSVIAHQSARQIAAGHSSRRTLISVG